MVYAGSATTHIIYRRLLSSGSFTAVAGSSQGYADGLGTSARFDSIFGLSGDSNGYIFIADYTNNRVRKVETSTFIVTTIAGTGSVSSTGDGGDATSGTLNSPSGTVVDSNGNIYVVEYNGNRVR